MKAVIEPTLVSLRDGEQVKATTKKRSFFSRLFWRNFFSERKWSRNLKKKLNGKK
jgi:hypothetical protein